MNLPLSSLPRRRWPWLLTGYLLGIASAVLFIVLTPKPRWEYELTADVPIERYYFFKDPAPTSLPSPLQGVLKAGTRFELQMRNSVEYFISFNTAVNGPDFSPFCKPLPGSPPFLDPRHVPVSSSAPGLTPACSGLATLAADARR